MFDNKMKNIKKTIFILILCSISFCNTASPSIEGKSPEEIYNSAMTLYWLGLDEKGDKKTFEQAHNVLNSIDQTKIKNAQLINKINILAKDLEVQLIISSDTLIGVFPLTKLFTRSLFFDWESTGNYDLIDDARDVAVRSATHQLVSRVLALWEDLPQLQVVVSDSEDNQQLVNEVYNELVKTHKLFINSDNPNSTENGSLKIEVTHLLNEYSNYGVLLSGTILLADSEYNNLSINVYGFSRERHHEIVPIIIIHTVLFILAISLIYYSEWLKFGQGKFKESLFHATMVFIIARTAVWGIVPAVSTVMPEFEAVLKVSFWYPSILIPSLVLGILVIITVLLEKLNFKSYFIEYTKLPIYYAVMGIGLAAYLSVPIFLYLESAAWSYWISAATGVIFLFYNIGKNYVDNASKNALVISFSIILLSMLSLFLLSLNLVGLIFVAICSILLVAYQNIANEVNNNSTIHSTNSVSTLSENSSLVYEEEVLNKINDQALFSNKICWLTGGTGVGKTRMMNVIAEKLSNKTSKLLYVKGKKEIDVEVDYSAFENTFSSVLGIDLIDSLPHSNDAIGKLFDQIVPFSGLLSHTKKTSKSFESKSQLFSSVLYGIQKLSNKRNLIFVVDDYHLFDKLSVELFTSILDDKENFNNCTFIITSRNLPAPALKGKFSQELRLPEPSLNSCRNVLEYSLGFEKETSFKLSNALYDIAKNNGQYHYLYALKSHLLDTNQIEGDSSFKLKSGIDIYSLDLPNSIKGIISKSLLEIDSDYWLIGCAACIGESFSVSTLCDALELPRKTILKQLDALSTNTNLITDDSENDDCYRFSSAYILEMTRNSIGINNPAQKGDKPQNASQLVKEMHHSVAKAQEKELDSNYSLIVDVAFNFYSAGSAYSKIAASYAYKAAIFTMDVGKYNLTDFFIWQLDEADDIDSLRLRLLAIKTFKEGDDLSGFVESHLKYNGLVGPDVYEPVLEALYVCYRQGFKNIKSNILSLTDTPPENCDHIAHFYNYLLISEDDVKEGVLGLEKLVDNALSMETQSKVFNALGELYTNENPEKAIQYFEKSIKIKTEIDDIPGLARSLGGIGRLHLYTIKDIEKAIYYLQEDLSICEQINDKVGLAKINSQIGYGYYELNQFEIAQKHYKKALTFSNSGIDKAFSLIGLIKSTSKLNNEISEFIIQLENIKNKAIPDFIREEIEKCLGEFNS